MILNPEAQRRGQDEITRVIGNSRLPNLTDRADLPFVDCIVKETLRYVLHRYFTQGCRGQLSLRWYPVLPLGVPHKSVADDEYRGMFIPAGSTIIPNARYHRPVLYRNVNVQIVQRHYIGL